MILNCDAALITDGMRVRYVRAKVGIGYSGERCFVIVITSSRKERMPFTPRCTLTKSSISFPEMQRHLYMKNFDELLMKMLMTNLRSIQNGNDKPKLPTLKEIENQKLEATTFNAVGMKFNLNELKNKSLTRVTFEQTKLVPKIIWSLRNLTVLELIDCHLDELPKRMNNLINLQILNLSKNQLKILDFNCIRNLTKLLQLIVNHNQLVYIPLEICFLRSLVHIDFSHNAIKFLPLTLFKLVDLKEIILSFNEINFLSIAIARLIKRNVRLVKLDLSGNRIIKTNEHIKNFHLPLILNGLDKFPTLYSLSGLKLLKSMKILNEIHCLPRTIYYCLQMHADICFKCNQPIFGRYLLNDDDYHKQFNFEFNSLASTVIFDRNSTIKFKQFYCYHCKVKLDREK